MEDKDPFPDEPAAGQSPAPHPDDPADELMHVVQEQMDVVRKSADSMFSASPAERQELIRSSRESM